MAKVVKNEKGLLIKELCSRLPYDIKFPITVKNPITSESIETIGTISGINRYGIVSFVWDYEGQEILVKDSLHIKDVKPYLFPLSSMTNEQYDEMSDILHTIHYSGYAHYFAHKLTDWYNKNHFDYRELIKDGLAIDATGLNIY